MGVLGYKILVPEAWSRGVAVVGVVAVVVLQGMLWSIPDAL